MGSMLEGAPWLLAHKSMLKINQPQKFSLYGRDYVLWKDGNDEVHALPNACPHMGAMLSEGWCEIEGNGSSCVVCPFHALAFDAGGHTILPGTDKKTLSLLKPLQLIIRDEFIWCYGENEPLREIPTILEEIARSYDFIGYTGQRSVETDLLTMLLNMHDYNHQNGTHREVFRITEVKFRDFIDSGHLSHAFYDMPTAPYSLPEKLKRPALFLIPPVINAHLENHFPSLVIFYGKMPIGKIVQCHIFIPEDEGHTKTYVLVYGKPKHPLFKLLSKTTLEFVKTVVDQDADILGKIYPEQPQKIKLNNEVGMDWVKRNFKNFPHIEETNLSLKARK